MGAGGGCVGVGGLGRSVQGYAASLSTDQDLTGTGRKLAEVTYLRLTATC